MTALDAGRGLPAFESLTMLQQRGVQCVFCDIPLSNATAHDLGTRTVDLDGCAVAWYPRSCPYCQKGHPRDHAGQAGRSGA